MWISSDKVSHFFMKFKRTEYSVSFFIKQSTNRNILKQKLAEKKLYAPFS